MPKLFGYGSLINKASASRTLGRKLNEEDLQEAILYDYTRTWGAPVEVILQPKKERLIASFLNIREQANSKCQGIVFEVSEEELRKFDQRETGYQRLNINVSTNSGIVEATTYITIPDDPTPKRALQQYIDIVNEGLKDRSENFTNSFWTNTAELPEEIVKQEYNFN